MEIVAASLIVDFVCCLHAPYCNAQTSTQFMIYPKLTQAKQRTRRRVIFITNNAVKQSPHNQCQFVLVSPATFVSASFSSPTKNFE